MTIVDAPSLELAGDVHSLRLRPGILRDRIRARLLAEMEAEHESLSARPDRVAAAEALIDRIIPDPANPKGER